MRRAPAAGRPRCRSPRRRGRARTTLRPSDLASCYDSPALRLPKHLAPIAICLLLCAAPVHAQSTAFDTYVNAAVRLYESLEYERAIEQLEKAKKLSRGVEDDVLLLFYEGAMKMDLGQTEQGRGA